MKQLIQCILKKPMHTVFLVACLSVVNFFLCGNIYISGISEIIFSIYILEKGWRKGLPVFLWIIFLPVAQCLLKQDFLLLSIFFAREMVVFLLSCYLHHTKKYSSLISAYILFSCLYQVLFFLLNEFQILGLFTLYERKIYNVIDHIPNGKGWQGLCLYVVGMSLIYVSLARLYQGFYNQAISLKQELQSMSIHPILLSFSGVFFFYAYCFEPEYLVVNSILYLTLNIMSIGSVIRFFQCVKNHFVAYTHFFLEILMFLCFVIAFFIFPVFIFIGLVDQLFFKREFA